MNNRTFIIPSADNTKITGRTLISGDVLWLVQSGAAAELEINASSASVIISGDIYSEEPEDRQPRYAVYVNDKLTADLLVNSPEKEISLFSLPSEETVHVKIIHLSEANNGAVGIKGFIISSSSEHPARKIPDKKALIEFIGDSITCAYGVEGGSQFCPFRTSTENFMKSYAYLTAQAIDADYSAVSYSGFGVVSAYSETGIKDDTRLVPSFYTLTGNRPEYSVPWDFKGRPCDINVINLGTNDINYVGTNPERKNEFYEGYLNFLRTVRYHNPDSFIVCCLGIMDGRNVIPEIEKAVYTFKATADNRICFFRFETQKDSDKYGSDWHPSEKTQKDRAEKLAEFLTELKKQGLV